MDLREGTTVTITFGPFLDKTDGVTAKTAVAPTVKLAKNGGTLTARNSVTTITHDADGYYKVELNATDTNTKGRLRATARDDASYLPVWLDFDVVASDIWDEKYGAQFLLQAATGTTATLDTGSNATDNYYTGTYLQITSGPGVGQIRRIIGYVGATKVATLDSAWITNPTSASNFRIVGAASVVLTATERDAIADATLDRTNGIETGWTLRQILRLVSASLFGKVNGAVNGTSGTANVRDILDTKNRLVISYDSNGNRTTVVKDAS